MKRRTFLWATVGTVGALAGLMTTYFFPTIVVVDRPVEKIVEKPVEVVRTVEKVVDRPVEVVRMVDKIVEVPTALTPEQQEARRTYGRNRGIAFQLVDDLLDFTANAAQLGKPVLSDLREGKVTLPLIRLLRDHPETEPLVRAAIQEPPGETTRAKAVLDLLSKYGELERARLEAHEYADRAREALRIFPASPYREALTAIARYIVERDR